MTNQPNQSLHDRILAQFRQNIISGLWQPGQKIPFETEMAAQHGVSRMTMNKVLAELSREGFLERRRKVGTFIRAPRVQSAVMDIPNIGEEIRKIGRDHSFSLITREARPANEQDRNHLRTGESRPRVLFVECVHFADNSPFCHEWRLVNLDQVPSALDCDLATTPMGSWLLSRIAWTQAEHAITAINPVAAIAKRLGVSTNTACLQVERLTELEGKSVTYARFTYRGDMHQFIARFVPTGNPLASAG